MTGYAEILALWIRALQLAEGRIADREFRAMRTMVDATWDALAEAGNDMAKLKIEVRRLMAEGEANARPGTAEDRAA